MPLLRFSGFGRFLLVSATFLLFDQPFCGCAGWGIEDVATILGTLCKAGYSVFCVATPSVARFNAAGS